MNTIQNIEDTVAFLQRFCEFYDSLVWKVEVNLGTSRKSRIVKLLLGVRDGHSPKNEHWVNVTLNLKFVSEFCIKEDENSQIQVLSGGIVIRFFENILCIDLDPYTEDIQDIEDIRKSSLYFCCQKIEWETSDYQEHLL